VADPAPYVWALKPRYYRSSYQLAVHLWPAVRSWACSPSTPGSRPLPRALRRLARAGTAEAETAFGFVTDVAFWTASLDVIRRRMQAYGELVAELA
jgi:hypothetical protein